MRITWISMLIAAVTSLTLTERNEISRKFKYYYNTVRPTAPENFVSNVNGTHYRVLVEFHLIETHIKMRSLFVNAIIVFHWTDDRLILRELFDDFELPKEFEPWLPRVRSVPSPYSVTVILSPANGILSLYHRVRGTVQCSSSEWKYPFETFDCELPIENAGDELIIATALRDLRPQSQTAMVGAEIASFPQSSLRMMFSADWDFALLSVFLPSFLIVALVFFAQWKRRKVQILVSLAAIICMLILLVSSRPYLSATLLDLWISGCFVHTVFLLVVDLTLPARRLRYALLVDVDDERASPKDTILKSGRPHGRLVGYIQKLAEKVSGSVSSDECSTHVIAAPSENASCFTQQAVTQRRVTTTTLGERKKFALLAVATSFTIFIITYCVILLCID
ncbi:Ligand-Gated ion Channel [Trichostrongylus colubriformis]|uniref:Ligand-Gated ion Channel n=1 Tax=Trichostrongylus colubriformis TaxID=6319 RepID=A0AAN8FDI9_TRICO